MRRLFYTLLYICVVHGVCYAQFPFAFCTSPKYETRAVWITTYGSLDWPHEKAVSSEGIEAQKAELCRMLDRLEAARFNTVLLQTRIRGTVIYPSAIEGWDECLTGTAGRSPGYDPLAFAVEECHKRGMELHAWVVAVPYVKGTNPPAAQRAISVKLDGKWNLDPGRPETATYLARICKEIVSCYDVDGIHLDYMRYPDNAKRFNDKASYAKYGGRRRKADWRAENITRCVGEIYKAVKEISPWVKVSSAPLGKRKSLSRFSSGGWDGTAVYQDPKRWFDLGIHDMVFPMLYFRGNHFFPFLADWGEIAGGRPVVAGLGAYFLSKEEKDWPLQDVTRELSYTRFLQLGGQAYYRYKYLDENHKGLYDFLSWFFYSAPSLPARCWNGLRKRPEAPKNVRLVETDSVLALCWDAVSGMRYNVYAGYGTVDTDDGSSLVAIGVESERYVLSSASRLCRDMRLAVTSYDRYGNESNAVEVAFGDTVFGLRHDDRTLWLEGVPSDKSVIRITDAAGRLVLTTAYSAEVCIELLPKGFYVVECVWGEGVRPLGYFVKA